LASNKRFDALITKNSQETNKLKTTTASLRKELKKTKSEKATAILTAKQAATKAQGDILASNKRFDALITKNSQETNKLKTTTASLRKELKNTKSEKATAILTAKQAATKAQGDILASNKRFDALITKNSQETNKLKTTTASLRKELKKTNSLEPINKRLRLELEKIKGDSNKMQNEQKTIKLNSRSNTIIPPSTKTKGQELIANNNLNNKVIVTSQLYEWVAAWKNKNTNLYLSFYSKNFKDPKRSRTKWEAKRRRSLKNASNLSIEISDIRSSALDNVITMSFIQRYKAKNIFDLGEKELIWKKEGQNWKIIKETWRPSLSLRKELKKTNSLKSTNKKLRLALEKIKDDSLKLKKEQKITKLNNRKNTATPPTIETKDQRAIITSRLYDWAKAWTNQNTNLYLSFYSKNFKDPKRSRSKWEAKRRRSLKNASNISIQVSDIRIDLSDKKIKMTFIQRYAAKNILDLGEKELIWKKEGQSWKIIKETWSPSFLLDYK